MNSNGEKSIEQLRQDCRTSPDDSTCANCLMELQRLGALTTERIGIAAGLGSRAASATGIAAVVLPEHFRSKIASAVAPLTDCTAVRFAIECAERALRAWRSVRPEDRRPMNALHAARSSLDGSVPYAVLDRLSKAAESAALELDDPSVMPDEHPEIVAAMNAAVSASNAAFSAKEAMSPEVRLAASVAWAANFAAKASRGTKSEQRWQVDRLIELLLFDSDS